MRGHRSYPAARLAASLLAAALAAACRYQPMPVVLQGAPDELRALAGSWVGRYGGTESGREGSIELTVRAAGDSAFGEVVMTSPAGRQIHVAEPWAVHQVHASSTVVLRIVFVRLSSGRVSGELEPYVAPDCDCTVTTTFEGTVTADAVQGSYITRGAPAGPQTGRWRVTRQP